MEQRSLPLSVLIHLAVSEQKNVGQKNMTETILQPEEINPAVELANKALAELDRILLGRSELHRLVFAGVLSRGHILLEGLPGVGKTALVKALGGLLNLQFNRVQF